MRILLTTPYDLTHAGGVTSHVLDLAAQLRVIGHDVEVAGPKGSGSMVLPDYVHALGTTHPLPTPGDNAQVTLNPGVRKSIRNLLEENTYDVIHLHEPFLPFIGPAFLDAPNATKVATFHTSRRTTHWPYFLGRVFVRRWNKKLHGRIAVSETAEETAKRYMSGEFRVIPNGVEFARFEAPQDPPPHLADGRPTVLYVGRLEARKGISYLLEAFKTVKAAVPTCRLVIVGNGGLMSTLKSTAEKLGLDETDVLFEGFVPSEVLPAYYQAATVFCSPSTANESFGITLAEAMAAGTPVVATSVNGSATLGSDHANGLVVPVEDANALAGALLRILLSPDLAAEIATSAREYARRYDWANVVSHLVEYYEECGARQAVPAL